MNDPSYCRQRALEEMQVANKSDALIVTLIGLENVMEGSNEDS